MDQVVRSVEDTWNPVSNLEAHSRSVLIPHEPIRRIRRDRWACRRLLWTDQREWGTDLGLHSFRGSDDDLRSKFEEYICSVLATLKYSDYVKSGQNSVMPGGGTYMRSNVDSKPPDRLES